MHERGQTLPFLVLLVALAAVTALVVVQVGERAVDAARARTAADAAALAGARSGAVAARDVAEANHAELVRFEADGPEAEVTVAVGQAEATARARQEPRPPSAGGTPSAGLDPRLVRAISRAEALLGERVPITSGWRSRAEQQRLWDQRHQNPYPVARPGTSRHEQGLAIDVPRVFVSRLRSVARASGLCFPLPATDPVHFELCPGPGR